MARKQMTMRMATKKTFEEGAEEFILNCEARNLRSATIKHYKDSLVQIYKIIPKDTLIEEINEDTWDSYKLSLRKKAALRDTSIYTYGRDCKTILRFFMKKGWMPQIELQLPKADKAPTETYTDEELKKLLKKSCLEISLILLTVQCEMFISPAIITQPMRFRKVWVLAGIFLLWMTGRSARSSINLERLTVRISVKKYGETVRNWSMN